METRVGSVCIGGDRRFALIAGPCVLESEDLALRTAERLAETCAGLELSLIFKSSFDKANRTSLTSYRGPGIEEGLRILARVRAEVGVPVTTDVHEAGQAAVVAEVADLLQVPAFLCRQTDLLAACGATGKAVNVKKGQFVPPWDMRHAVEKVREAGASGVLLTERGTSFGHGDLVVDYRGLPEMRRWAPIVFDATHSCQRPGQGGKTGGDRTLADPLARAALAVGVDAIFAEVHPDPDRALSDAATQLPLDDIGRLLAGWIRVDGRAQGGADG
jgi:2-dehydro-3-deoxyphosphooctonate aldolase (KDO 8-P synthase)